MSIENPEFVPSDARLLRKWTDDRDAEAFREIVARHVNMVFSTCRRVSGNAADAEDAAQECFLRLATAEERVQTSLAGWLHRVATRISLSRRRSDRRRARREEDYARQSPARSEDSWTDMQRHVDEAIEGLSEKTRSVIVRHFLEGEPQVEIARALGISAGAVHARLRSGIERIRKHLKRRGFPVPFVALAGMLRTEGAQSAPAALTAALARLALSGITVLASGGGGLSGAAVTAGALSTTKIAIALCGIAFLGFLGVQLLMWPASVEDPVASTLELATDYASGSGTRIDEVMLPGSTSMGMEAASIKPVLSTRLVDSDGRSVRGGRVQIRWGRWDGEDSDPRESVEADFSAETGWEPLSEMSGETFVSFDRRGDVAHLLAVAPGFLSAAEWVDVPPSGIDEAIVVTLHEGPVLRGRVVDALAGDRPISGARVGVEAGSAPIGTLFRLESEPVELFHEAITGADGRFEIAGVLGPVWALKEGFGPTVVDVRFGWADHPHDVPMFPVTSVRLRVFEEKRPVEAFEYAFGPFKAMWPSDWRGIPVSGSETEVLLVNRCSLAGGSSTIVHDHLSVGARVRETFVNQDVRILLGTDTEVDLDFGSQSTAIVGIALDGEGHPVSGAIVLVGTPETPVYCRGERLTGGVGTAETGLDGTFHVPVQPGQVFVVAHLPDHAAYLSEWFLVPDRDRVEHTVRFPAPARVAGTIADGVARRDGRKVILAPVSGPSGSEFLLSGFSKETSSDASGSFTFDGLPPGCFEVRLARVEGESVDTAEEICAHPGSVCRLVIGREANADGIPVVGRVVSGGEPVEAASVVILGRGFSASLIALSKSDASGSFVLEGVPSGLHRLNVYAESPGNPQGAGRGLPSPVRPAARSRIVQVEVSQGMEPVEVDLSLWTLEGRVTSDGGAVDGVEILASSIKLHGHRPSWMGDAQALTASDGSFRLEGLYATLHRLLLRKEGYLTKTIDWKPASLDFPPSLLEIAMEPSGEGDEVLLQVFDGRRGEPLDGELTASVYPEQEEGGVPMAHALVVAEGSGGSVSVRGLPPGNYLARVDPMTHEAEGFAVEWVRIRRERGIDQRFQVSLRPGGAIRVRIATGDGSVPEWSSLELWREDGTPIPPGWHNGLVELFRGEIVTPRLPAERIRLRVVSDGHAPRSMSAQVSPQSTELVLVDAGAE